MFVTGVGLFSTVYLTPLFLARVRGFDAWQTGLAVLSTGLFQPLAIPIHALLARRIDLRWLMMAGLACFGARLWLCTPLTHDWGWRELLLQAFRGFAQQFAVAPTVTLTLGGAIGIAACGTVLNNRANLHFLRSAERLTPANGAADALLGQVGARARGGAQAPPRARLARGAGADLCRCLPADRGLLCRRHPHGIAHAPRGTPEGPRPRTPTDPGEAQHGPAAARRSHTP